MGSLTRMSPTRLPHARDPCRINLVFGAPFSGPSATGGIAFLVIVSLAGSVIAFDRQLGSR
jgi:hypothetical protein